MKLRFYNSLLAFGVLFSTGAGAQQERVAPLPPPCDIEGPGTAAAVPRAVFRQASLAVLPLAVGSGAAQFLFLSDGVPSAIAARIGSAIPRLYVVGRRAQRRHAADRATIRTLGNELGVGYVLGGSLGGSRTDVRVIFSLYDASTGRRTWTRTFLYDSSGALPIEQTVAVEVAARIVGPFTQPERDALVRVPSRNHAAYEASLRGDVSAEEFARSLAADAYRRALQLDPTFADASAKLALTDADVLDDYDVNSPDEAARLTREVRMSADRAMSLDPNSAIAWLAQARAWMLDGRPTASWSQAFGQALARDSTNPAILAAYGTALMQANERARARGLLERATALDPGRGELWTSLAELAATEKRDVDACVLLNRAIHEDALYAPAWALRALLRGRHDDLRFAWADAETAERLGSTLLGESAAAVIDLTARDTVRARERLAILWQDVRDRKSVSAYEGRAVAVALLAAGDNSRALDVLESVRPLGPRYAASLLDSSFDRLRNEPRFRALVSIRPKS
jgi:TolB-like protein/Tfp pilus assembly protein PilF